MAFRYVRLEEAKVAAAQWDANPDSVEHIENFSSSVFKFSTRSGMTRLLRFVDHEQRTFNQVLGELEFLVYLKSKGIRCCAPEPSISGAWVIPFEAATGLQSCSSMAYVSGFEVTAPSPHWNEIYYREWGRNLASIHQASRSYAPAVPKRWQWDEEHLLLNFDRLIPRDDPKSRGLFRSLMAECRSLPKTEATFGLIHADHAPNNLIFNPATRQITAIDFGNCCYHWYLADLGIALSVARRHENREEKSILNQCRDRVHTVTGWN